MPPITADPRGAPRKILARAANNCAPPEGHRTKCLHVPPITADPEGGPRKNARVGWILDLLIQEVIVCQILNGEMSREALMGAMGVSDAKHFRASYLRPALDAGLVEMTQPDKPRSVLQRYRLTSLGRTVKSP